MQELTNRKWSMVELFREDSMTFKVTNSDMADEVGLFISVIDKCKAEAGKKGFRNIFNSEERAFIREFAKKINGDEVKS
jgi:hypothetical protein